MGQIAELEHLEPLLSGPWDARGVEVGSVSVVWEFEDPNVDASALKHFIIEYDLGLGPIQASKIGTTNSIIFFETKIKPSVEDL